MEEDRVTITKAEHDRLKAIEAGRRYRAVHAEWRRREREERAGRRAINYVICGVYYRLLPGQRLALPLTDGGTLTLCGAGGDG